MISASARDLAQENRSRIALWWCLVQYTCPVTCLECLWKSRYAWNRFKKSACSRAWWILLRRLHFVKVEEYDSLLCHRENLSRKMSLSSAVFRSLFFSPPLSFSLSFSPSCPHEKGHRVRKLYIFVHPVRNSGTQQYTTWHIRINPFNLWRRPLVTIRIGKELGDGFSVKWWLATR